MMMKCEVKKCVNRDYCTHYGNGCRLIKGKECYEYG